MNITKDHLYNDLMQQLNDSRYIPVWVKTYMGKTTLKQSSLKKYKPFRFRIYYEDTDKPYVNELLKYIPHLEEYFIENIMDLPSTNINIVLILSKKVKMIDKSKNKIIDKDNINSGVCIHSSNSKNVHIIIYRKEDLMKVLFHEIIHYIGADLRIYDEFKINNIELMIQTYIPSLSNVDIYFNEAFTEALARYHYIQFMMENDNPNLNLKKQQKYSIKIVKKFLALYDCRTLDEFSKLKNYNEESHAFSYIVIASALLNSEAFISDIIINKNRNMDNLERIVYKSLLQTNDWYKRSMNKRLNKDQMKFYLKLSI
tara:strand:- start:745 stop:1686 length:942 start_codon:yes stop_codon:yes gene_type:complete